MSAVKNVIKDNYNMMLLKDYLRNAIKDAGFSHAEISKTPTGTRVALHVTRPGIVIGRKGSGIRELTEKLGTDFGLKNPQISVNEIEKPDLSPSVMCNRMASHLERGTAFRRATMWTMKQIMESGVFSDVKRPLFLFYPFAQKYDRNPLLREKILGHTQNLTHQAFH